MDRKPRSAISGSLAVSIVTNDREVVVNLPNELSVPIRTSPLMEEWNIALCPMLYKSTIGSKYVLHNKYVLNIGEGNWYRLSRKWQVHAIDTFNPEWLIIPDCYKNDILGTLAIDKVSEATVQRIMERSSYIPDSIDASCWRFLHTSQAILMEEAWKVLEDIIYGPGIIRMSKKQAAISLKTFYVQNTEYAESRFRQLMIQRKVVMPFSSGVLRNNPLCASSTPQNDKAGMIAEMPLGMRIDEVGNAIRVPIRAVSVTGAQCAFPGRLPATREVVLRAISQAMYLPTPETPYVVSNYEHIPHVDTVNLFAARMSYFGLTHEDGIVISSSAARKLTAYKTNLEHIEVSSASEITVGAIHCPPDILIKEYEMLMHAANNKDEILEFVNKGKLGIAAETGEIIPSRYRGLITHLDIVERGPKKVITVETFSRYILEIGSKLMDRNSNKGTISAIIPDWQMPEARIPGTNEYRKLDIITPPTIVKRGAAREMEEICSIKVFKTKQQYRSTPEDTLESIRKSGTNVSKFVYNINPDHKYAMIASDVPVGFVAFAVLNQNPKDKIRFAETVNTNYQDRSTRGLGNYNFTDGIFAMLQSGANDLVSEIRSYCTRSNNLYILSKNMEAIGTKLTDGNISIIEGGIFKKQPYGDNPQIIEKGVRKTDPDASTEGTIFDVEEGRDVCIKIPRGISLSINSIVSGLGSRSIDPTHVKAFIQRDTVKDKMKQLNIPIDHVFNSGKEDRYIYVPHYALHTYTDYNGNSFASAFMNRVNELVLIMNNTIRIKAFRHQVADTHAQIVRCNIAFNTVINDIMLETIQKSGVLRDVLSPRVPYSIYAVASGTGDADPREVFIPVKTIMRFIRSEEFRKAYYLSEDMRPSEVIEHFNKFEHRAIIMRQPCHQRQNISSLIIRAWSNNTIGIHNGVIKIKDGDLDGDCLFAYFPISKEAKLDATKMKVEDVLHLVKAEHGMEGLEFTKDPWMDIMETAKMNTGAVEDLSKSKHLEKYEFFGSWKNNHRELQSKAAMEFKFIKSGAASGGGIGNAARHVLYHLLGIEGIRLANKIYHSLAQAALDSKHSTHDMVAVEALFSTIRQFKDPGRSRLETMASQFMDLETVRALTIALYDGNKWRGGIVKAADELVPMSRLLYRGGMINLYRAAANPHENSVAKLLAMV